MKQNCHLKYFSSLSIAKNGHQKKNGFLPSHEAKMQDILFVVIRAGSWET